MHVDWFLRGAVMKLQSAGEARFGLTAFHFTRAGRRRHHDPENHSRVCYRIEQRRCDGCFGLGEKCFFVIFACSMLARRRWVLYVFVDLCCCEAWS